MCLSTHPLSPSRCFPSFSSKERGSLTAEACVPVRFPSLWLVPSSLPHAPLTDPVHITVLQPPFPRSHRTLLGQLGHLVFPSVSFEALQCNIPSGILPGIPLLVLPLCLHITACGSALNSGYLNFPFCFLPPLPPDDQRALLPFPFFCPQNLCILKTAPQLTCISDSPRVCALIYLDTWFRGLLQPGSGFRPTWDLPASSLLSCLEILGVSACHKAAWLGRGSRSFGVLGIWCSLSFCYAYFNVWVFSVLKLYQGCDFCVVLFFPFLRVYIVGGGNTGRWAPSRLHYIQLVCSSCKW